MIGIPMIVELINLPDAREDSKFYTAASAVIAGIPEEDTKKSRSKMLLLPSAHRYPQMPEIQEDDSACCTGTERSHIQEKSMEIFIQSDNLRSKHIPQCNPPGTLAWYHLLAGIGSSRFHSHS